MGLKMERVFLVFMVIFSSLDGARCFHCDIDKAKQATLDMAYCLSKLRHLRLQKCSIIKHIFNDCFDKQSLDVSSISNPNHINLLVTKYVKKAKQ